MTQSTAAEKANSQPVSRRLAQKGCPAQPLTATLTNGFFSVDNNWTVVYWNKAAEKLLGVSAENIIGKNLWDCFADKLPVEFYAVYQKAFLKNTPVHFEEYWSEMGCWFNVVTYYSDNRLSVSFKKGGNPLAVYAENAAERLKTLTELYRFVTEITNDCLWEWDVITEEIFWIDGGHKRVFGYDVENALVPQRFWESCIHPDDSARVQLKLMGILAGTDSNIWEDEYRFLHADGHYVEVYDRGHIIYSDGVPSRIIGATQDISARVQLQNKLEEERASRQKHINEAIIEAQETERNKLGYELQENLAQLLSVVNMYLSMAERGSTKTYIRKAIIYLKDVIKQVTMIYHNLLPPDLVYMNVTEKLKELTNDLAAKHGTRFTITADNTECISGNEKLQVTLYRIIQHHLNTIVAYAAPSAVVVNISCYKSSLMVIVSDDGKDYDINDIRLSASMHNIKCRADLFGGSAVILTKPGEGCTLKVMLYFDKETNSKPALQNQGVQLAPTGVMHQVPADFAMALCHEIRNPLTNIMLCVDMLQPVLLDDAEKDLLKIVARSATRINGLLSDLLSNYKGDDTTLQSKSICQLLNEVTDITKDRFTLNRIAVEKHYAEDGIVLINIAQIKIALINIVTNALEAMPPGKGVLKLYTKMLKSQCVIEISDNGTGISKENLKNIFKPYFSDKQGGMGLGLSTTMSAFLANHVKVEVTSKVGEGTCFTLLFRKEPALV